ncbi:glycosyltransferase [soil metagenome]
MVKVLFVSPVADLKGGAEQVLLDMMKNPTAKPVLALPGRGALEGAAASLNIPVVFYDPGAIVRLHRPLKASAAANAVPDLYKSARHLRRLAQDNGCSILHSNGLKAHLVTMLACIRSPLKSVAHLHDIPYSSAERAGWSLLNRGVDRMIAVSRPCWPGREMPANLQIIPNGIPITSPIAGPANGSARSELRLGFVGRFHPHKGLLPLVTWIVAARAEGLPIRLHLRGAPDPDHGVYWQKVQDLIAAEALGDTIVVDGWRPSESVLDDLDVLVVPSDHPDPLPRVVMEAGHAALPVIATRSGGIPDMIVDGRTGFLVDNDAEFIRAVQTLHSSADLRKTMGLAARRHVESHFSLGLFHKNISTVYSSLQ